MFDHDDEQPHGAGGERDQHPPAQPPRTRPAVDRRPRGRRRHQCHEGVEREQTQRDDERPTAGRCFGARRPVPQATNGTVSAMCESGWVTDAPARPTTRARTIGDWPEPAIPVTIGTSVAATTAANASDHRCGDIRRSWAATSAASTLIVAPSVAGGASGDVADHLIQAARAPPPDHGDARSADHAGSRAGVRAAGSATRAR